MNNQWLSIKTLAFSATVWLLCALASVAQAQQNENGTEVYLTFQYRGVVSNYVTAYYKDNQFYLPVRELFSLLEINHTVDQGTLSISGVYLGETDYQLDFRNQIAKAGGAELELQAEDFLIKEIDYFLKPEVFKKLFGLTFTTNFNNLTLDLETTDKMPVVAAYERKQERKRLDRDEPLFDRSYYPLQYDRNYQTLNGAFLDYNLSAVYSNNSQLFTFSNSLGAEVMAGDVQGNIFGAFSDQQSQLTTQGLRWRYVQRDNNYFSSVIAGQTNSEGISSRAITGIKISNKPIEPRRLFDRYPIEGNVPPQSEVELYLNNRLVDFQKADESGNYRFLVPLTYGSTNYSVQIYTPAGQSMQRSSRIQVPFDYLPPGEVDYSLSGGQLENPVLGSSERGYLGEASLSAGITNWLTASGSTEYLTNYHSSLPSFTGTLNARLFTKYLVSASANSENFYRLSSSVVYNSGASWNLSYDYNPGESRLYNTGGSDHLGRVSLFTPFQLGEVPLNMRWSSTYQTRGSATLIRYRADLSSRLGRLNIRLGYQDQQSGNIQWQTTSSSRITNSYTYSMGRFNDVPALLRGMFIRGQLSYLPGLQELEEMEFQLSRDLFQTGRLQLTYGRNFLGGFNSLSLNVTIDFNKVRSNTSARTTGSDVTLNQSLRGSIGYDSYGDQLLLNNRQQVGQAGAAVRLFVDNNNDGSYQDSTDDVITDPAVRMNRAGGQTKVNKGINYISQLLPYYRYDLEINKGALSNPLLVPDVENFSMITDPNQYKTIEIPFYLSGVISGRVDRKRGKELEGLSGVRLYLKSNFDDSSKREPFSKEMRTFSDGSFYTYEVPPGKYQLFIDPNQLDFLQSEAEPDTMGIEVEALAEGDFVEGLHFVVTPAKDTSETQQPPNITEDTTKLEQRKEEIAEQNQFYKIQLASFKTEKKAKRIALEAAKQLGGSFSVVYNTNTELYGIRSVPLQSRRQAIETILSYHNSQYKQAALVVVSNGNKKSPNVQGKFIQIGAFSTKEHAEQFAQNSSKKLHQEIAVTYNQKLNLYKVYINQKFNSEQQRKNVLSSIRSQYAFDTAFINEEQRIQIGAFSSRESAQLFADQAQITLQKDISVSFDEVKQLHQVYVDEKANTQNKLRSQLSTIRNTRSPFNDAFVTVFNDTLPSTDQTEHRALEFTYQVEIEGVTEDSEQAFISSITDGNADTNLKKPDKDRIRFENVTSWTEAQQLQQKLSKISTIGRPIVILIEKSE
ncbi:SPOR domain-containing protein [Fodinibius sp. SL11]|uniref:SPOR domain-containing protein n=1 Tax=Fodinibius sp. SL11 TaxID=3425690 RepID=UPI003F883AF7